MHVKIDENVKRSYINLNGGLRQADTISPKLFTLALEQTFKEMDLSFKKIELQLK